MAGRIDTLFYALLGLSTVVVLGVASMIVIFAVRYRRGSNAPRSGEVRQLRWELGWTLIPLALFLAIFVWAAWLYFILYTPPGDAMPVYVVGKQWMWQMQHVDGQREINQLHVPVGRPVKLIMTSQDVIHSFFVPAFRVKQDVLPGRYTTLWFEATKPGEYHLFCAEYCGTDHARMGGSVIALRAEDYRHWLGGHPATQGLAAQGERLFPPIRLQRLPYPRLGRACAQPRRRVRPSGAACRRRTGYRGRGVCARFDPAAAASRSWPASCPSCPVSRAR